MKFSPFIAPSVVLIVIAFNQTFAGTAANSQLDNQQRESQRISQLQHTCHQSWQQLDWTIGENALPAARHPAFSDGIKRVCQARAELFFEGYEISPFIEPDSQAQIYPIVFRPSVEEIKSQLRLNLPKLRLI